MTAKVSSLAIGLILAFGVGNPALSAPNTKLRCVFVCEANSDKTCSSDAVHVTYVLPTRQPFPKGKNTKTYKLPVIKEITKKANGRVETISKNTKLSLFGDGGASRMTIETKLGTNVNFRYDIGSCEKVDPA